MTSFSGIYHEIYFIASKEKTKQTLISVNTPRNQRAGERRRGNASFLRAAPAAAGTGKIHFYSVQPKVSIRVDGATELGTKISQSEAAAANVRVMPELKFVADWPPRRLNSVASSTRIETFG